MDSIIQVRDISKKYRLGRYEPYQTLRDTIVRNVNPYALFRKLKKPGPEIGKGEFWALKDISFDVNQGEIVGIIGRNGTGKSTLLKILSRITLPTSGQIKIRGQITSLLEVGAGFSPELTGKENIFLNAAILGMSRREVKSKFDEIVAFAEVEKFINTPVKYYSSGMYMRLAFAVAAHLEPDILLVDEVLAVGDSEFQKKCLAKMQNISSQEGRTILYVSHNLISVQKLCQKTILLDGGRIKKFGETKKVINAYLNDKSAKSYQSSNLVGNPSSNLGNIRFYDIKVSNADGFKKIKSGDKMKIRLKYTSDFSKSIDVPRIVIIVISQTTGQNVLWLDSDVPVHSLSDRLKPNGVIECLTNPIDLMEGRYSIEINFHIQGQSVDRIQNAAEFDVETDLRVYKYRIPPDSSVCDHVIKYSFKV